MCSRWVSSSSRNESWPYELSISDVLASPPAASSAASSSTLSAVGYIQSEVNESSRNRARAFAIAAASEPPPYARAGSKYVSARESSRYVFASKRSTNWPPW